jgi:hypothetical protein
MAWMALVSSMIWLEIQVLVLLLLLLDCLPLVVGQHLALLVRQVLADHHEVDRNMASSDTIMVSSPNG